MKLSAKTKSLFWIAVVVAVVVLTWIGLSQYYPETNTLRYLPDRIFRLVKTLAGNDPMGSGVEPENLPIALIMAKILVTLILLRALLKIVEKVFHEQYTQFRAACKRDHTLVLGAGERSSYMLQSYAQSTGKTAVAIEPANQPQLTVLPRNGHVVLTGDPTSAETLISAGALKAAEVICFGQEEKTGVQSAARLVALYAQHSPGHRLRCFVHLNNPRLVDVFRQHSLSSSDSGVDIVFFNLHKMRARRFFNQLPQQLASHLQQPQAHIHLLLVGFDATAQALLLQGLRVFHLLPGQSCQWSIYTSQADARARQFADQYPEATQIAPIHFHENNSCWRHILAEQNAQLPPHGTLVLICAEEDSSNNLDTAATLLHLSDGADFPVYVHGSSRRIAPLLAGNARHRLHFFGDDAELCDYELITCNTQDRLAQAIHADYLQQVEATAPNTTSESKAFQQAWLALSEEAKDANRAQADHIIYKLLLTGQNPATPPQFSPEQIEQLAETEHQRWAAHLYLNGWRYGSVRDDAAKQHPSLVNWADLNEGERQKDRDTILRVPALWQQAGSCI